MKWYTLRFLLINFWAGMTLILPGHTEKLFSFVIMMIYYSLYYMTKNQRFWDEDI